MRRLDPDQVPFSFLVPESTWEPPTHLPDLVAAGVRRVAVDMEARDDGLLGGRGPGWPYRAGYIAGVSMAWDGGAVYAPVRHPDSACLDEAMVAGWVRHHLASGIEFIIQNSRYDLGWFQAQWGIPPPEHLHDTQVMAVFVDENRRTYNLDDLCAWQGVPGKDAELLLAAGQALGCGRDPRAVRSNLWRMPARFVGPYAEQDSVALLGLADALLPRVEAEGMVDAYRLEMDLVPMVVEMRRRGIRVDLDHAQRLHDQLIRRRDEQLAVLSRGLQVGRAITIHDVNSPRFMTQVFTDAGIPFPMTPKSGMGSFQAKWMQRVEHWLPQACVLASKYHEAADKFVRGFIQEYAHRGRIHSEVHLTRGDDGGTRSHRFSYSDPPLQQMPARDAELGPAIRGCFLPEEGELWAANDYSQQEYRLIVHFAALSHQRGADKAVEAYNNDPDTDFHVFVAEMTGLDRKPAKDTNFAKAFGAGVPKFAAMIGQSVEEAAAIYEQYDQEMPFVSGLSRTAEQQARQRGYIRLLDGARNHFDDWEVGRTGGTCSLEEARRRVNDPTHPWHGKRLRRAGTHKAMSRLIQGSAARQVKMAMRACWREGLVPLVQLHDELDHSVSSERDGRRVAELMRDIVQCEVPMKVDTQWGWSWGQASAELPKALKGAPLPTWDEVLANPGRTNEEVVLARSSRDAA